MINRPRYALVVLVAVAGLTFLSAAASQAATLAVAYIEPSYPDAGLSTLIQVQRGGKMLPISGKSLDLLPGDRIYVEGPPGTSLTVRYIANNASVPLSHNDHNGAGQADMTVQPSSLPGLDGQIMVWFKDQLKSADQGGRRTALASRGIGTSQTCFNATGRTDDPTSFNVPILAAKKSQIIAGQRRLFISWRGGASPYSVALADAQTGRIIAKAPEVRDVCSVRLPLVDLRPGRYSLRITDANNVTEEEGSLFVAQNAPDMPMPLKKAALTDQTRELYFATWLSVIDGGEWAFEAQQRVAGMDCRSPAVQDWLSQWGAKLPCN